jgi:hypothetical protein
VTVRLTPRDERLLRAVARFGIVRTPDLVRLLFPNTRPDTAARRLRKAFDAGLLDVRAGDRARPNVYSLGPRGRAWAQREGVRVSHIPRGDIEHHAATVAAWSSLAAGCGKTAGVQLRRFIPDWELRKRPDCVGAPVIPDALVELAIENRRLAFALEVDRGGERALEWRRKLDGYRRWLDASPAQRIGLVVLAEGGPRRRAGLEVLADGVAAWCVVLGAAEIDALLPRIITVASPYAPPLLQGQVWTRKS